MTWSFLYAYSLLHLEKYQFRNQFKQLGKEQIKMKTEKLWHVDPGGTGQRKTCQCHRLCFVTDWSNHVTQEEMSHWQQCLQLWMSLVRDMPSDHWEGEGRRGCGRRQIKVHSMWTNNRILHHYKADVDALLFLHQVSQTPSCRESSSKPDIQSNIPRWKSVYPWLKCNQFFKMNIRCLTQIDLLNHC